MTDYVVKMRTVNDLLPWVLDTEYDSLEEAVAACGADEKHLLVTQEHTLTEDLTTPTTLLIECLKGTDIITDGYTLTLGSFKAGLFKVFTVTNSTDVVFSGGSVDCIHPEWWGAVADASVAGATLNTTAINYALESAKAGITLGSTNYPSDGGMVVKLSPGNYRTNGEISITGKHIRFEGSGPGKTVIQSTVAGNIVYVDGSSTALQGTTVANMMLQGDGFNVTTCLKINRNQFHGVYFEKLSLCDFTTYGMWITDAWNGLGIRDIYVVDNTGNNVATTQYGIFVSDECNDINFQDINIQGLSTGHTDTVGMCLEGIQYSTVDNATIKNVWTALKVTGGTVSGRPCKGLRLSGLYCEPNDNSTVTNSEWVGFSFTGATTTDPASQIYISNSKIGWGHGQTVGTCYLFDLDKVEDIHISRCDLKANISGGTTYHVRMTADSKFVHFYDDVVLSPSTLADTSYGLVIRASGDVSGLNTMRRSMWLPAESFYSGTNTWFETVGATDAVVMNVLTFPDGLESYAHATFVLPHSWGGDTDLMARVLYTAATGHATNVFRFRAALADLVVDTTDIATAAPAGNILNTDVPDTAYVISSRSSTGWTCTAPRLGAVKCVLFRDGDAAADDAGQDMYILGVEIWVRKTVRNIDGSERYF